ncbi:L,D-transpeptidase [bacterium]|nr:L,D-transpeptidase [bacterium]
MFRPNITIRIIITALATLLCLSTSTIGAENSEFTDEVTAEKPPSFAASRYTEELIEPVIEELIEPVTEAAFDFIPPEGLDEPEPERKVIISLADQQMWIYEDEEVLHRFLVSTGVPGHRTPTGNYSVRSQAARAYSNKYECAMPNWSAITSDGLYGMHALDGTSYLRHLGSVASHGCIRLAPENAEWLFNWVEIGTPVDIVDDYTEPPEVKAIEYRVERRYCY